MNTLNRSNASPGEKYSRYVNHEILRLKIYKLNKTHKTDLSHFYEFFLDLILTDDKLIILT